MVELPSPVDVVLGTLLWIGVPAALMLPLSFALWLLDWIRGIRQAGAVVRTLGETVDALLARRPIAVVHFALVQALLLGIVYSVFRLDRAIGVRDAAGRSISDGKSFTWAELWLNLTSYSAESQLAVTGFWVAAGWLVAVNLAALLRIEWLFLVLALPAGLLAFIGKYGAIGAGIIGALVLIQATLMSSSFYSLEMVSLYLIVAILCGGIAVVPIACVNQAAELYGIDL